MAYNTLKGRVNFSNSTTGAIESMVDDYSDQSIDGNKTFTSTVSASAFFNTTDGTLLTSSAISSIVGDGVDRVLVSNGDGTATAYSNLTYDGTTLTASVSGSAASLFSIPLEPGKVSGQLSASNIYFGNGLQDSGGQLIAQGGNGIFIDGTGINVDLATTGGLANDAGKIKVSPNDATAKGSLSNGDSMLISDADASNATKKATMTTLSTYMQNTLTFPVPGGSDGQVQYKSGTTFAGNANLTYDGSSTLTTVNVSASGHVSSSLFVGDGGGLYNVPAGNPAGENFNIQFNSGSTFSGSNNLSFTYDSSPNTLKVIGDISASNDLFGDRDLVVARDITAYRDITSFSQISASLNISASGFYGDGLNLNNVPMSNYTANRLVLCGGTTNTLDTFADLTWNNPTLNVPGTVQATTLTASTNVLGQSATFSTLHISGSEVEGIRIAKGASDTREIVFENEGVDVASIFMNAAETLIIKNESNNDDIQFQTRPGGTVTTAFTIDGATANVGVGTIDPLVALDVRYNPTGSLSDDTGGGDVVNFGGGTLTAGKLYYLHTDGNWTETDADAPATGADQLLGIALGSSAAINGVLIRGFFDAATYLSNFTVGKAIYVSTTTGSMDTTAPSAAGDFVRIVGYCTTTANVIYFNPSSEWIELA